MQLMDFGLLTASAQANNTDCFRPIYLQSTEAHYWTTSNLSKTRVRTSFSVV